MWVFEADEDSPRNVAPNVLANDRASSVLTALCKSDLHPNKNNFGRVVWGVAIEAADAVVGGADDETKPGESLFPRKALWVWAHDEDDDNWDPDKGREMQG